MTRALPLALLTVAHLLHGAAAAAAHGFVDRAEPRAGSTVKTVPVQVRIWFTGAIEPAYSRVRVLDETGQAVDRGDSRVDDANRAQLSVSLPATLKPGRYKVHWRVLSIDSHVTEGDFSFRLAP